MVDNTTPNTSPNGNSRSISNDSYVLVSDSNECSDDVSTSDYYSSDTSDGEQDDIFPSPPPPNAMADSTPVRSRVETVPSPRWSSPTAAVSNADPSGVDGAQEVSASYHELANRPRSNPRVRTPMRNVSPFLGTVNRSTVTNDDDGLGDGVRANGVEDTNGTGTSSVAQLTLGAGRAVGTVFREEDLALLRQQKTKSQRTAATKHGSLSDKQGPSHRKLRRWNNDKLVGIASEISRANPTARGTKIANIYTEADLDRNRYVMPHDPPEYRSHFTTLLGTGEEEGHDSEHINAVRRRFLRGDTSDPNREMTDGARDRLRRKEEDIFNDGSRMVRVKVPERLLNVVRRACQSSPFSRNVLSVFERKLVRHLSADVNHITSKDDPESILEEVLVQKLMVTRKARSTTLRFLFENENHGAFNRILLHGVSHFHGLHTSSTTTSRGHRLLTVTGACRGCRFKLVDFLDLTEEFAMDGDGATMYDKDPVVIKSISSLRVN